MMTAIRPLLAALVALTVCSCQAPPAGPLPGSRPPVASQRPLPTRAYIGLTVADAAAAADKAGVRWRVVEQDGVSRLVTMDHQPERVNFTVVRGKVTRVTKG